MLWAQGLVSFVVWILYGVFQTRRLAQVRAAVERVPRSRRGCLGALILLVAAGTLFGGLIGITAMGGFAGGGMTALGWLLVTLLGLGFVHAQTMAVAMLATLAQGEPRDEA